ncbi:UDP-galactose 4-epimerase [Lishizhenia tianjinensis]|uniref:UDP-glucose 4-epimerase n=1 Tax=Lishizhenia tianjinensis TaxID=477690 RepID=A0A1I6ZMB3_9FLAO|nr:UDP-glucose 4-epimerase GalE [Lishizhenia tianjinensis]SFT63854.1 UDP-galactose 4-epimerase [Lishizhenia tianjinensis]
MTEKKYVLVTGGAGYIGSHTVLALINNGYEPVILDNYRNANENVPDRLERISGRKIIAVKGACQDEELLNELGQQYNFWGVIHFAADKAVGESVQKPLKYYDNNLTSFLSILNFMEKFEIKNIVFSSSCTVYGAADTAIVTEETPLGAPLSPYGASKLFCEQILKDSFDKGTGFKVVSLRYFNPIGAHSSGIIGEEPQGVPNNLMPYITQTAIGEREALTVFGNDYPTPDGTCVRDYIHVVDLAEAHVLALNYLDHQDNKFWDAFNLGTGVGTSVKECIDLFAKVTGKEIPFKYGPRRPGDVPQIYAKVDKARDVLKWEAKYDVAYAIETAWNWEQKKDTL